jgi:hypothetical protein
MDAVVVHGDFLFADHAAVIVGRITHRYAVGASELHRESELHRPRFLNHPICIAIES